jgi:putative chitinase
MTPEQLQAATGCTAAAAAKYAEHLTAAMAKYGIATKLQVAGFIGNCAEESGLFTVVRENLNYSAKRLMKVWPARFPTLASTAGCVMNPVGLAERVYAGRMGNTQPGDGGKYLGRGLIQLTGKDWYSRYSKATGVDAVGKPDLLLEPFYAADSAGWFWKQAGCNPFCDAQDWHGLTKRINGNPDANFKERKRLIDLCLNALGA